jgi:hypothetical protein
MILTGSVRALSDAFLMARIYGQQGQYLNQASVASIAYQVTDTTTGLSTKNGTLTVASTVYNSLQQGDPRWTMDTSAYPGVDASTGYNFAFVLPGAAIPKAVRYQVDVVFSLVGGGVFRVSWQFVPQGVYY